VSTTAPQATIVERPVVKLDGTELSGTLETNLMDTRVELVTNGVSQATLRFYDADFELLGSSLVIGTQVEIAFPPAGSQSAVRVFTGEVVSLAADQGPNDLHELVVTAFDLGHRMARNLNPKVWQNVAFSDIVSQIASASGMRANVGTTPQLVFPYLLQTTDDRTFLGELADRLGVLWRVDGDQLVVEGAAPAGLTVRWGRELRRFNTRINAAGPLDAVEVRGWDVQRKETHVARSGTLSKRLSDAGRTSAERGRTYSLKKPYKKIMSGRVTESQKEAEILANAVRERLDSGLTQARGEVFGDPAVKPGMTLTVEGMGAAFSGTYVLTSVEHVYSASGYVTRFQAGWPSGSGLADLVGSGPRPFYGATIGIVTNNDDLDIKAARVKVKFPLLGDSIESTWARVVSVGAGPSRGLQITPAVNDEVIVIFENGDVRRPIVLGGVWNGNDRPPKPTTETTDSGATNLWHLRTKAGHQLTFDDRPGGKENVTILLKDGATKLYLGVDKIELWANNKTIEVKSGQASVLLSQTDVTIDAMNITLKAKQALKLQGLTVEAAAQSQAKLNGATVDVNGTGVVNVQASGPLGLKGMPVKIN
jgi:phage protein D/phage baseplate assembly protein gpV